MAEDSSQELDIMSLRSALAETVDYARTRANIFPRDAASQEIFPGREAKEDLWQIWQRVLDLTRSGQNRPEEIALALDSEQDETLKGAPGLLRSDDGPVPFCPRLSRAL